MTQPKTLLKNIARISPKYLKILTKFRIFSICDFLYYFPFRYDDFRKTISLSMEHLDQTVTIEGKIIKAKNNRIWKRKMTVTEIIIENKDGEIMKAVWFNQPYILESLTIGSLVRFSGKLVMSKKHFQMINPAWEKSSREATNTGRFVPIYSETTGITSKWIRWQMKNFLPLAKEIPDIVPPEILKEYHLYDLETALTQLHFPDSMEKLVRAKKRMAFEEMFLIQLRALQTKKDWEKKNSLNIQFDEKLIKSFVSKLPFKLTNAQRKAAYEILKDLEKATPMNRLLNGDVGSGKTIVVAIASLEVALSQHQVAIMAPTEVLARQHFLTFSELLKNYNQSIALLTNSYKKIKLPRQKIKVVPRKKLLSEILSGNIAITIGTHALIQKDVVFKKLALTIIDEQHRFGVTQRVILQQKTMNIHDGNIKVIPHLLTMTATPIPRTLAIAYFGSLDLSILDEMPRNRRPIITKLITPSQRTEIYNFTRSEIKKGFQIFVILPLVEESQSESMSDVKAVTVEHKRLSSEIFPECKLGLLHGRLKAKEKEKVMKDFKNKDLDILVSTSVVEVGIDIPNATIMLIENAERFGLAQLHQFRGRVGRGENQSYCFLFSESGSQRLKIMQETNDGFRIAEKDLTLRGPGQFFGTLQSGIADITMENLSNIKLIKFARAEATEILTHDPSLKKHPLLADALKKFSKKIHLE